MLHRGFSDLLFLGTLFGQRNRGALIACFQRTRFPMIQFVGNTMAVTTLGKTCHHAGRMWYPVTALAGWYRLVLVLIAGHTEYVLMFCITAGKHLERTLMTGRTHFIGSIGRHENRCRHMGLMAFFTLGRDHIGAVRLVALCTKRNLTVNIVAETACQAAMLALDLLQLDNLLGMACQALLGDVICQLDYFWSMRIVMAAHTAGQVVVRLSGMALAAGRNNLFD